MSVTKARALITKHHKYAWVFTLSALLVVGGVVLRKEFVQAATYTFNQTSWAGGLTANTAVHASNQSGWTQYSATSTGMTVGTTVALTPLTVAFTDDGATSTVPSSTILTGGGFANGTNSTTALIPSTQVVDTFTAANGSVPSTALWTVSTGTGVVNIQNNTLYISTPNASAPMIDSLSGVGKQVFSGDFDFTVDFSNYTVSGTNGAIGFEMIGVTTSQVARIQRLGGTGWTNLMHSETNLGGVYNAASVAYTATSGSFRIKRSGSTITTYYFSGGVWVLQATWSGTESMYPRLFTRNDNTASPISGNFDNFTNLQSYTGTATSIGLDTTFGLTTTGSPVHTTAGGYEIYKYTTGSGTFQITKGSANVDYLVVAGGGGGGGSFGGGGGAGGLLSGTLAGLGIGTYTVTVGAGGIGNTIGVTNATNGGNSTFSSITAVGGGYGAGGGWPTGNNGGSGGGGGYNGTAAGLGTVGQGNNGGTSWAGGGGGGAGAVGASNTAYNGTNGGAGIASSITGSSITYAGGGGGGGQLSGAGGLGGGGNGGGNCYAPQNGTANTGGGGGGGSGVGGCGVDGGTGGSGVVIARYLTTGYYTSGVFTSAVINFGVKTSPTTLAYATTLNGQTITVDIRAGNTPTPDGTWTAWQTNVASGGSIAGLAGNQYFQYRANLSTTNSAVTPTLDSVTINSTLYSTTGTLTSSVYDTADATNLISKLAWTATGTSSSETVNFQVRSSPDNVTWSNWCGMADTGATCTGTNYFTSTDNGVTFAVGHPLRSNSNDRYFQYKMFLASAGAVTPAVTSVTTTYVVNAAPNFDTTYGTNGVSVYQDSTSTSSTYGKVFISYSVRDIDTTTGTTNPGFVTPSFEYSTNGGSTWVAIPGSALAAADTANKAVSGTVYTTYTATWTASSTAPNVSLSNAQVRVTVNDNEAANNTAQAASANFILDTTAPSVTAGHFVIDSSTAGVNAGTITLTATDGAYGSAAMQYRLCNDSTFPTTDAQGNSCAWSASSATLASTTVTTWVLTGAPSNEAVYLQARDLFGNVTSKTAVAPAKPGSFDFKDISNLTANPPTYREFLSWSPFVATTSSAFGAYKVYTSLDGVAYSLLSTITDSTLNYYIDNITTATTSLHYYKVAATNANSDVSDFTAVVSDVPNGVGGAAIVAPTVSTIAVPPANIKNTSVQITFTTDLLARATVYYASYTGAAPTVCPSANVVNSNSYLTSQSVYLTGLTSNTNYVFCVKATEVTGLSSTLSGVATSGGTFTTVGGPVISNVTVNNLSDVSATIFWNTSTSSDGFVYYATNASLAGALSVGSSTPVTTAYSAGVYQHQVGISGLTAGTTYYFKVTSTDGAANISTADNNGQYYSFLTTYDRTPPTVSGIATPVLSSTAAVIVWQTDEPATTQVLWGTATGDRSRFTVTDTTLSIYHVVTLSAATTNAGAAGGTNVLTPSTPYYFVVKSADAAGNTTTSTPESTFTTPATGSVTIFAIVAPSTGSGVKPDTTPPVVSGVKVSDITPFGATVTFNTDKDATCEVAYGKSAAYTNYATEDFNWGTSHTVKLNGLVLGSEYHLRVKAIDKFNNVGTSDDQTFKTAFLTEKLKDIAKVENVEQFQKEIEDTIQSILPSLVPPFVSKPLVTDITESGATVSFKTNIKAFPVVGYVEDGAYDVKKDNPYTGEISDTTAKATVHTLTLKGLKANTKYHIQARAFSLPQVIGKSEDITFLTTASKIAGSIVDRKKDSFTVVWTTSDPTSSIVEFKDIKHGITQRKADDAKVTAHSMKIENLPSGTTYEVFISGMNSQGNITEAGSPLSVTTSTDVTPPVISGFKVDNALVPGRTDRIQTIVSWTTDEPANAAVYYEEGAGAAGDTKELANKQQELSSYVTAHSMIVPSLKPGTIYRIKIESSDDSGNLATFGPRTVITPRQTESITDIIFKNFEDSFKFLRKI